MEKPNENTTLNSVPNNSEPSYSESNKAPEQADAITPNAWSKLNAFTDARVGLGRAGVSVPTKHLLAFQLAHAQAIDAVHTPLDIATLSESFEHQAWSRSKPLKLHSQAMDRASYLQRPDYGRRLNSASADILDQHRVEKPQGYDLVIAVVDGLSALAVEQNTLPFLNALFEQLAPPLNTTKEAWTLAPICLVEQGRVAIGDDICQRLNAKCVVVLVGERPGLSSPDSLGLYLTWDAKVGRTDAFRNCISNIRPAGLTYAEAARKTHYLLKEASRLQLSGVSLKDRSDDDLIVEDQQGVTNFLVSK